MDWIRRTPWQRTWFVVTLCVVAGIGTVCAVGGTSASFEMVVDALTAGGGPGVAASYVESDSAISQETEGGSGTSASYREECGVVLGWGEPASPTPTPTPEPINVLKVEAKLWKSY